LMTSWPPLACRASIISKSVLRRDSVSLTWSISSSNKRGVSILRHEDVSTTQRFYIKTVREDVTAAMKRLEAQIAVQQLYSRNP
jgi:hypothetical protein